MSKDRKPRYFDFIHQHEERLNLIYSRWEAQIANQNAANKSKSLLGKIGYKKATLMGMAIAFGSVLLASQCGKVDANKTAIASNSQKIARMSLELGYAAADPRQRSCVGNDDIYQLTLGNRGYHHHSLFSEYGSFMGRSNTISLTRRSSDIGQPDVRLRINPNHSLSFGSTEHDSNIEQTSMRVIDLNPDADGLPIDRESAKNYRAIQEEAIALHEELFQCYADNGALNNRQPLPRSIYAD